MLRNWHSQSKSDAHRSLTFIINSITIIRLHIPTLSSTLVLVLVDGSLEKNTRAPHTYIFTHEFPIAINAVTTADLVVACTYVVGRACMISKMVMPEIEPTSFRSHHRPRRSSCSHSPCAIMMEIHSHANQIIRACSYTATARLPPRLTSS